MSRKALTLTLMLTLLFSLLGGILLIQSGAKIFVKCEDSNVNTIRDGNTNANITIQSPENKTCNSNNVTLAFTIESDVVPRENFSGRLFDLFLTHGCVLDYDTSKLVQIVKNAYYYNDFPDNVPVTLSGLGNRYVGNATLTNLPQGSHNLTVWIRADQYMISYKGYVWSVFSTVLFNIDTAPTVSILSPETKTYNASEVPLDFTVNEAFSQISYSIDGHRQSAAGNKTLTGLSNGVHNVTVFVTDKTGNVGASETISFTISNSDTFSTLTVVVSAIAFIVIAAGLLVYHKKHKNAKTPRSRKCLIPSHNRQKQIISRKR